MSRDGSITLTWADGDYAFRLGWGEIELIQEACDAGPWTILERMQMRQCYIGDISDTLHCALIGGGTEPVKAKKLIELYVEKRPPAENLLHAIAILQVGLHGTPDETVGEPQAASPVESSLIASPMEN